MAGTGLSRWGRERAPLGSTRSGSPEVPFMTTNPASTAGFAAAPLTVAPLVPAAADTLAHAARMILPHLERGQRVDAPTLRGSMVSAYGGSDADGAWDWKTAYDACEAATVLFLAQVRPRHVRAGSLSRRPCCRCWPRSLAFFQLIRAAPRKARRFSNSRRRSPSALAASAAAAITPADLVLEPSAGTGLLAILAELCRMRSLVLNELAETRAGLLSHLFPGVAVTRFDAAQIHDHLDAGIVPSVVLMNPPFSALANVDRRMADAALRHIASALSRLAEGGRLVAITGANCAPDNPAWADAFARLQERGRIVFSAADRRIGVCQAWHDHRHAADRDRPSARPRSDGVSGLTGQRARCRNLAWLDRRIHSAEAPARHPSRHPRHGSSRRRKTAARCAAPFLRPGRHARVGGG